MANEKITEQFTLDDIAASWFGHGKQIPIGQMMAWLIREVERLTAIVNGEPRWNDSEWSERWQRGKEAGLAERRKSAIATAKGVSKVQCDVCGESRICHRIRNEIGDFFWICRKCPKDVRWEEK